MEAFGREEGDAPPVDLDRERAAGSFVRAEWVAIRAASDLSDGGLALAAFEMAAEAGTGLTLDAPETDPICWFFGEDQGRYLLAVSSDEVEGLLARAREARLSAIATIGDLRRRDVCAWHSLSARWHDLQPRSMQNAFASAAVT